MWIKRLTEVEGMYEWVIFGCSYGRDAFSQQVKWRLIGFRISENDDMWGSGYFFFLYFDYGYICVYGVINVVTYFFSPIVKRIGWEGMRLYKRDYDFFSRCLVYICSIPMGKRKEEQKKNWSAVPQNSMVY